jgi:UDP-GlcNAc:undecaprenyl-phosphate GlcNAc-1-phosphate transferase
MPYLFPLISFFVCLALTPAVRKLALSKKWLARPTIERWHKKPTPLMGGVAIYAAVIIPLLATADLSTLVPHLAVGFEQPKLPGLKAVMVVGLTLIFILGLLDDFINIKPQTKLVGQFLVASLVTYLGFRLHWFVSLTLDTMITIVWIVGITNAFNLLDNMDGLCAGVGFIAAAYLSILYSTAYPDAAAAAMILAGATGAFLIYNFNPASIFMGDSGSMVIGFFLSMICMYFPANMSTNALSGYAVPVMLMVVPIFDTTMVTLIRLLSGRKASTGGKDHASHRLVLMGLTERGAVLFLFGVGAISGLSAIFVSRNDTFTSPTVIIPLILSVIFMGIYLSQIRVYPEREFSLLRGKPYTPILIELTYKRQLILVILDFGLIAFAYYLSYRLKFDTNTFPLYFKIFLRTLPAIIACKFAAFFTMGIYRGIWRYLSTNDVYVYLKSSLVASLLSLGTVIYIYGFEEFSKGLFLIDFLLTTGLLLGTRGSFRISMEAMKRKTLKGDSVFIYGAGRGGEILLREILNNKRLNLKPVGFIDDDVFKKGKKLLGYPVLGTFKELESLCLKHGVTGMLKSFNHHDSQKHEFIKMFCKEHGLFLKQFSIRLDTLQDKSAQNFKTSSKNALTKAPKPPSQS